MEGKTYYWRQICLHCSRAGEIMATDETIDKSILAAAKFSSRFPMPFRSVQQRVMNFSCLGYHTTLPIRH